MGGGGFEFLHTAKNSVRNSLIWKCLCTMNKICANEGYVVKNLPDDFNILDLVVRFKRAVDEGVQATPYVRGSVPPQVSQVIVKYRVYVMSGSPNVSDGIMLHSPHSKNGEFFYG